MELASRSPFWEAGLPVSVALSTAPDCLLLLWLDESSGLPLNPMPSSQYLVPDTIPSAEQHRADEQLCLAHAPPPHLHPLPTLKRHYKVIPGLIVGSPRGTRGSGWYGIITHDQVLWHDKRKESGIPSTQAILVFLKSHEVIVPRETHLLDDLSRDQYSMERQNLRPIGKAIAYRDIMTNLPISPQTSARLRAPVRRNETARD